MFKNSRITLLSAALLLPLSLAACASGPGAAPEPTATLSSASSPAASDNLHVKGLSIKGAWVKAADSGMSAAFGTITNDSGLPITITSATTPASPMVELHETITAADGTRKMRAKQGGFTIKAHESLVLEPGANHIMLMGLNKPIRPGDDITFTLNGSQGEKLSFTAPAKDFAGAKENYDAGQGESHMEHK